MVRNAWRLVILLGGLLVATACSASTQAQPLTRYQFSHAQMGTQFRVVLYAADSLHARRAVTAAFARIDTLNQHLSDYLSDSELNRLSATAGRGEAIAVSDDLWTVLRTAQRIAHRTDGAFDVTVGPLTRLWRWADRRGRRPPEAAWVEAREAVGYQHVQLDAAAKTVRLARPGMRLDLGGIAKGFAADEALAVLETLGVPRALVDAGGDLRMGAPPPGAAGWRILVRDVDEDGRLVQRTRRLARCAVATSGDTYRHIDVDGVRYSHIIDPRRGEALTKRRLVVVAAPTGMQADALASALSVLGPEKGLALTRTLPAVSARIIEREDATSRHRLAESRAFEATTSPLQHSNSR